MRPKTETPVRIETMDAALVDITIIRAAGAWPDGIEPRIEQAALAALNGAYRRQADVLHRKTAGFELSVTLSDDPDVRALNRAYRGVDKPTNVLSFAQLDEVEQRADFIRPPGLPVPLGDVIIAHTTVVREAARDAGDFSDHLCHLVVHGVLHLVGFDHIYDDEAGLMESLEGEVLAEMGICNPYAVASDQHFSDQQ